MYFPPTANSASSSTADSACDANDEPRFFPPLWQQRRNLARRILEDNNVTSVIDFGCGEAALMSLLIWESIGDYPITRLAGVELREERLQLALEACQPQDFELGSNLRVNELIIDLFQGSVDEPDQRIIGFDALVCLEVVEHLDPPVLEKFWNVVLGTLKPKLVIVSTPNAEFNIYFPQLNYGTPKCDSAALKYGYDVTYTGTGALPGYNPEVGLCTQFAVLHIQNNPQQPTPESPKTSAADQPYHLYSRIEHPYYKEQHSDSDILSFLHEKIAVIRPRPPRSDTDEINDYYVAQNSHDSFIDPPSASNQSENTASNTHTNDDPPVEPDIELGVVSLEDLWLILGVRQRCKTRAGMIRILGQSPLVKVDHEVGLLRLDEDDSYWKEADRLIDAPYSLEYEEGHSERGSDTGDWSESSFYKDDLDNADDMYEDDGERKPYGLAYQDYIDQDEQIESPLLLEDGGGWSAWHDPPVTEQPLEWNAPQE
ncbi:Small RNA 2'-O-methyltransferase [Linnemannia exigua]|uniref:Small RNA 2'-O-methyltransferase n=1 Tax=Linnemannia exigua TaxID=604196 RepID=A0AAD4H3X7_9FUNG|nr:Small RNA 2'-O-methyltransferase [Linnemannia exigua]